ncbi:VOC family protein [Pseudomonas sp. hsmgli-8]|uniref:VOC family protein n=2 Tax=Pseudomonas TaxID=286 RepID=A0ABX0YES3_9PSED|nr:VOC family protein [Pseudomonas sp. LY10J]NJP01905.1 VOC family protein [Pseudomonas quercus]
MPIKYAHTNIISSNWLRLANFYIKVFDCKVLGPCRNLHGQSLSLGTGVKDAEIEGVHLALPGYSKEGPTLEIFQYRKYRERPLGYANSTGLAHIAFEVKSISEICAEVAIHGGKFLGKIVNQTVEGVGVCEFAYVRDPDGNIIEVLRWKKNGIPCPV